MSDDLVTRLRDDAVQETLEYGHYSTTILWEAADRIMELEAALRRAKADMQSWGSYADVYFREKWSLDGDLDAIDAALNAAHDKGGM